MTLEVGKVTLGEGGTRMREASCIVGLRVQRLLAVYFRLAGPTTAIRVLFSMEDPHEVANVADYRRARCAGLAGGCPGCVGFRLAWQE